MIPIVVINPEHPHRLEHLDANIPKSAGIALGAIIGRVLLSDNVSPPFKYYLFATASRRARDLIRNGIRPEYGRLIVLSLAKAGYHNREDREFRAAAKDAFQALDHVLQYDLQDEWDKVFV